LDNYWRCVASCYQLCVSKPSYRESPHFFLDNVFFFSIFSFMCMFCRSLFVLFFSWPLCWLPLWVFKIFFMIINDQLILYCNGIKNLYIEEKCKYWEKKQCYNWNKEITFGTLFFGSDEVTGRKSIIFISNLRI
jgi:hypothetical protein